MTTPSTQALAHRLVRIAPDDAALSRIAFDERFERWLSSLLKQPALVIASRAAPATARRLRIDSDRGAAELAFDAAAWPALEAALGLRDAPTAEAVATILLQPLTQALSALLPGLRVAGSRRESASPGAAPTVHACGAAVSLCAAEPALRAHIGDALSGRPSAGMSALAGLGLRPRVRLVLRRWPSGMLRTLRRGDTVLLGAARDTPGQALRPLLIVGIGTTLCARVDIHPQEHTVHVADDPYLTSGPDADDFDEPAAGLDELQVPVAFEVDTARISLGELASMRPGYAIELDVPLREASVRLVCHGQTVGHGQLVAIGDQLGVRITRMGLGPVNAMGGPGQ